MFTNESQRVIFTISVYMNITVDNLKAYTKKKLLLLSSVGNKVTCPCCHRSFRKFLTSDTKRPNAKCPFCYANERMRIVCLYFNHHPEMFRDSMNLLHVAPEEILYNRFSAKDINYYPVDLNPASHLTQTVQMDLTDLKYADEYFDAVFCSHVLEHIVDDRVAMKEIYRTLKKGGWAILNVPYNQGVYNTYEDDTITSPGDRLKHFGQVDHVRCYGTDYFNRLSFAGFEVELIHYNRHFSKEDQLRYGLKDNEVIIFCKK